MIILVSDTSILIDLERGGLLEAAFACGSPMVVPDLLYEKELAQENGPYLKSLGLGVVELSAKELAFAQQVSTERQGLSLPDCFALSCATRPDHVLVTGDKLLRTEALARIGNVTGLLWLLDRIHEAGSVAPETLFDGLTRISQHPRVRLPSDEVKSRLVAWAR